MGALFVDGLAGLAGGLVPESWLVRRRAGLIGFAAGTLLVAALLDILPAAFAARGPHMLWWGTGPAATR